MSVVQPPGHPGVPILSASNIDPARASDNRRQIAQAVNRLNQGQMNCILFVTLTPNATSTTVVDSRISPQTFAGLMPQTAHAAAELVPPQAGASCAFTVSGGVVTIVKSFNIASVVYNAVGEYTFTFTTPMSDADYLIVPSVSGQYHINNYLMTQTENQVAGSFKGVWTNVGTEGDPTVLAGFVVFDQAWGGNVTGCYVNCTNGSLTITHANNAQTDRTFTMCLIG